jgi:hypothetical protein
MVDTDIKSDLKKELFERIYQMQELGAELERIKLLPQGERKFWLSEYELTLNDMLDDYLDDSSVVLDELDSDKQMLNLSIEYVTKLRDVMYQVRSLQHRDRSLEG